MKYTVVMKPDPGEFSEAVTELLNTGWELHGSPQLAAYYGDTGEHISILVQALIQRTATT